MYLQPATVGSEYSNGHFWSYYPGIYCWNDSEFAPQKCLSPTPPSNWLHYYPTSVAQTVGMTAVIQNTESSTWRLLFTVIFNSIPHLPACQSCNITCMAFILVASLDNFIRCRPRDLGARVVVTLATVAAMLDLTMGCNYCEHCYLWIILKTHWCCCQIWFFLRLCMFYIVYCCTGSCWVCQHLSFACTGHPQLFMMFYIVHFDIPALKITLKGVDINTIIWIHM